MLQRFPCDQGPLASQLLLQRATVPGGGAVTTNLSQKMTNKKMNNMCPPQLPNTCEIAMSQAQMQHTPNTKMYHAQNTNKST